MTINDIKNLLNATVVSGHQLLDTEVHNAC